jgi:hypothetical protein
VVWFLFDEALGARAFFAILVNTGLFQIVALETGANDTVRSKEGTARGRSG